MNPPISVLYFGTPAFAVPPLEALIRDERYSVVGVVTQPDQRAGRGKKLTAPPVKRVAEKHGIPVLQPQRVKREWENVRKTFESFAPTVDVGVVCAFGQILHRECLQFPQHGCLNIHASLLPRWRGAAPIHRAILAGDTETGISLMQMDEGLDTGPWYVQQALAITERTTVGSLHDELATLGASMLAEHLPRILNGECRAHEQEESQVTYAEKISKAEAQIDWSLSANEVNRLVRGMAPFPGAYTTFQGKRLKLLFSRALTEVPRNSVGTDTPPAAGTVCRVDHHSFEVLCGDGGVLAIEELQLEGKGRLKAVDFLKGVKVEVGTPLGEGVTI
jgi:methionyl-tRNA formyltransferase